MKKGVFIGLCCSFFVFCLMVMAYGVQNEVKDSPSVVFPEPGYEFDDVFEGIDVVHDFVIQNKGTAALDVQKVSGGWGCIIASFTRQIPPGGEGKISVKLRTKGYAGRALKKAIKVYTNDKKNPVSSLIVKGNVKKFASISPSRVSLKGEIGDEIKVSVKISPATKGLFDIIKAKADRGKEISISLTEAKEPDGKAYFLTVENRRKTKGRYHDTIRLLTTSSVRKELTIPVYGNIKPRQIAAIRPTEHVQLRGNVGEPIQVSVTIVPKNEHLFDIIEAKADSGKEIRFTLTKSKETDGKAYVLTVENTRKTKGRYRDTIKLLTTSKVQKTIAIPISGDIRAPEIASIKPRYLTLTGSAGKQVKGLVKIIPNDKYPFSITEVKPRDGKNIKCGLKEVEDSGKKIYVLTVENLKKEKGRYYDTINLKTDSKYLPEIRISVSARISD